MKAVRYEGPTSFQVTDVPIPQPASGEVLIKVTQAGVCGTDLHIHHGGFDARFPLTPGHEVVGTVAALGDGVDRFRVGEQVTVNPNIPCGRCRYCLSGRTILCENLRNVGVTLDGFFAEYACVSELLVFSVEGLGVETAVFTEPTACAMHGIETLQIRPGSTAVVLGSGPTGLLLAQLIASGGASSVTVASDKAFQLEVASALGATDTVLIHRGEPEGNLKTLRDASDGVGFDIVVEATGAAEVGNICLPLVANGGTMLIYGVTDANDRLPISPYDIFRRELTIKGSFAEITSFGAAIEFLRAGRVRTDGIISHRFGLDDYGQALETLARDPSAHKVVVTA